MNEQLIDEAAALIEANRYREDGAAIALIERMWHGLCDAETRMGYLEPTLLQRNADIEALKRGLEK